MDAKDIMLALSMPFLFTCVLVAGLVVVLQHPIAKLQHKTSWLDKVNDDAYWEAAES